MANPRTIFNAISAALQQHEVAQRLLYGKQALFLSDLPFMLMHRDAAGFRLSGRALADALALEGAAAFDPTAPDEATQTVPGWVRVPAQHFRAWDALAEQALGFAQLALVEGVSWRVPEGRSSPEVAAPPMDAEAIAVRAAAAIKGGFGFELQKE
jgi:hypothetical protein